MSQELVEVRGELRSLLAQIHEAIHSVQSNAADAKQQVWAGPTGETNHEPCGDESGLASAIDAAEALKTVSLEAQAVAVDATLELLNDCEYSSAGAAALIARARALPPYPVELTEIAVVVDSGKRVISSPRGVTSLHVELMQPLPALAVPGCSARLHFTLTDTYPTRLPEEIAIATASLARVCIGR